MALNKYCHYFDIDPEYKPQVDLDLIEKDPDCWKRFYPHETFVKLMKDAINVIERKQTVSLWVEGAYGTGKSHAVLTLKKLIDASENDTREYFDKFNEQLDNDLFNRFQNMKQNNNILTVHRYGSSDIKNDNDLVFAVQESILKALKEKGINVSGEAALKESAIRWLSETNNKNYFNSIIETDYAEMFSGDNVDNIIEKLNIFEGVALSELMRKIMKVGVEKKFSALSLTVEDLTDWIKAIVKEHNFKAIVFIWDEFTEYFRNNMRALTGFQRLADLSGTEPFYFVIVTHNVTHIFPETDNDWKKILGRFVSPICNIELPENMAFRLMGSAMNKNQDPLILEEWNETVEDLYDRTTESRELVKEKAGITDKELKNILPIHPYTALLMKYISSAFDSNQRSMFDFIKNDRGDEIKGFQWFINNCGPEDDNPFLTVDMLWDFFYEKGKEYLSTEIRAILDCYERATTKSLDKEEKRVLKAVLLLQAISQKVGDTVPLFIANEKNIDNVFEGSDLDFGDASSIANKLVRNKILYTKRLGGKEFQFAALINVGDTEAIDEKKEEVKRRTTSTLIQMGELNSAIELRGALKLRYELKYAASNDFRQTINQLRNQEADLENKIMAIATFAKDDMESAAIGKKIQDALKDETYNIVFIDASITPLGSDLYEQYVDAMANSLYHRGKDNTQANQYEEYAKEVLKKWKNKIVNGEFMIYTSDNSSGKRAVTIDQLYEELREINRKHYPEGLETKGNVPDSMWVAKNLKEGVECGANEKTSGKYKANNDKTKLENYIGKEAWKVEKYWIKNPYLPISKIKNRVEGIIADSFKSEGRVSILKIYDNLKIEPYGFMPCSLTAFVLGFVLKEYVDGSYTWSNDLTNDVLDISKLKEMIDEIIKLQNTPNPRYKEKYIVKMTKGAKAFNKAASKVFNIPQNQCTWVENTKDRIRQKMKELSFPMWCLKEIVDKESFTHDKAKINELIDCFSGIVNDSNYALKKTASDLALTIGNLCLENEGIDDELKPIVTKEKCTEGMDIYIYDFENGILIDLANEIEDNGQYINQVKKKFDAEDANWVWNVETANEKIQEVILEYKIISESNKIIPKSITFEGTINEWCDRCNYIRISYHSAKLHWGELSDLMEMLFSIKRTATLNDSQKKKFLNLLIANGEDFKRFYTNQVVLFKEVCNYLLEQYDLTDEDIIEIFNSITTGQFLQDKAKYQMIVKEKIESYLADSKEKQLKDMWREKTNTESPKEWSKKYRMPILCMVPDNDLEKAKEAFGTINTKHADKQSIENAIEYIDQIEYFEAINDEEKREIAFRNKILKDYDVILDDVQSVKDYLDRVVMSSPYDWFSSPVVEKKLEQKAKEKYIESDCNLALEKIENMDVVDVKKYLKELIKDNMVIGIEIIKDN